MPSPLAEYVVSQQGCRLVAVEQHHLSFIVAYGDSEAVSIRVGAHHEVGSRLLSDVGSHLQGGRLLRVRGYDRREVSVRNVLLRHVDDVIEAETGKDFRHETHAAAVKRGVHYLEIRMLPAQFRAEAEGQKVAQIQFIHVGTHSHNFAAAQSRLELYH